jgi:hypothetical protein
VSGGGRERPCEETDAAERRVCAALVGRCFGKVEGLYFLRADAQERKIMTRYPLKAGYLLLLSAALLAGGCTTYYQIQDPVTGDVYYADDLKTLDGGAVRFIDAQSGTEVTVQNSDIKEISEDEYNIRRYEPEPSGETK